MSASHDSEVAPVTAPLSNVSVDDATERETKAEDKFRDYGTAPDRVRIHYRKMREFQSIDYVERMKQKYLKFDTPMTIWEAFAVLQQFVDLSDPDVTIPNRYHLVQTAEGMRKDGLPDWLQLVGLIHDLGKLLFLHNCSDDGTSLEEQWGMVGDTFVLGVPLPDTLPYAEYNGLSPYAGVTDSLGDGLYEAHCGLDNCYVAWGHDEYLYQVLVHHGTSLPTEALHVVRYHSLYPHHQDGAYAELLNEQDRTSLPWLRRFQKYDLYTKEDVPITDDAFERDIKPYYQELVDKYLGDSVIHW